MQNTAYEMRISYWRSDVCSSDLTPATAEPCCRLEEIAIARGPQRILVPGHNFNRGRDHLCQQGRRTRIDPEPTKQDRVSQHRKVALVGEQCVSTRMRCQRDFPCQVRLTKARMRSFLDRKRTRL